MQFPCRYEYDGVWYDTTATVEIKDGHLVYNIVSLDPNHKSPKTVGPDTFKYTGATEYSKSFSGCTSAFDIMNPLMGSANAFEKLTSTYWSFYGDSQMTGSPVLTPLATNTQYTYSSCSKITGDPVCSPLSLDTRSMYKGCSLLEGPIVVSDVAPNTDDMYYQCYKVSGDFYCGSETVNAPSMFYYCNNVSTDAVVGPKVNNAASMYERAEKVESYTCPSNVYNAYGMYEFAITRIQTMVPTPSSTRHPCCGDNVVNASRMFFECANMTGSPVVGPNVTNMASMYADCKCITGDYVFSPVVTDISNCYSLCRNMGGPGHNQVTITAPSITSAWNCFMHEAAPEYSTHDELHIHVKPDTVTNSTFWNGGIGNCCNHSSVSLPDRQNFEWTLDAAQSMYYNTEWNIFVHYDLT